MEEDGPGASVRYRQPSQLQSQPYPTEDMQPSRHPGEGLLEFGPQQFYFQDGRRRVSSPPNRRAGRELTADHL